MADDGVAEELNSILARAGQRAKSDGLAYAGALTPKEAYALWQAGAAVLVDVRTFEELNWVGAVPGAKHVEWKAWKDSNPHPEFVDQLTERVGSGLPILFLCRSVVRSHAAATLITQKGFVAYNVLEGFEGSIDADGHRGRIDGWRLAGLPWRQS